MPEQNGNLSGDAEGKGKNYQLSFCRLLVVNGNQEYLLTSPLFLFRSREANILRRKRNDASVR